MKDCPQPSKEITAEGERVGQGPEAFPGRKEKGRNCRGIKTALAATPCKVIADSSRKQEPQSKTKCAKAPEPSQRKTIAKGVASKKAGNRTYSELVLLLP